MDRTGPLLNFLSDIRRLPSFEELRLAPLEAEEVSGMIQKIIGGSFSEEIGHKVFALSKGNPLFVQEISRTLRNYGPENPLKNDDLWKIEIPRHIRTAISPRFERISSECRTLILKLALLGAHFSRGEVRLVFDLGNSPETPDRSDAHQYRKTEPLITCLEEADRLYLLAQVESYTGKLAPAMEAVGPLLESVRCFGNSYNYFMPYVVAAKVKMLDGNLEEASSHLDEGLLHYPYNAVLLTHRIHIEYLLGHIEEGDRIRKYLKSIRRGTNSNPSMFPIYYASIDTIRALCTGEYDELPETVHSLRSLIASPTNHPFILVRAHLLLCLIASLLDDVTLAAHHYRQLHKKWV